MLQLEMQLLKVEGKIIERWLVKKRVLFLNFADEGGAKLATHDWSSGCLATACAIEKFSATVTSRFEVVDEELKDKSENENTKNSTKYWKNVFKKWASLEEHEGDVLDQTLLQIYALGNSVIFPSMFWKVIAMDPRKIKD